MICCSVYCKNSQREMRTKGTERGDVSSLYSVGDRPEACALLHRDYLDAADTAAL